MRTWTGLVLLIVVACGGSSGPRSEKPAAPNANDPAFGIRMGEWYLVADAVTPSQDELQVIVDAPEGTDSVDVWVADLPPKRLGQDGASFGASFDISSLPVGSYDVLFAADGSTTAFAKIAIHRSKPYYVVVTTDWDFADPGQQSITYQNQMHRDHPELRMTHFVGPYTFTDPMMTAQRKQELVSWLVGMRDMHTDEIGLHIHPYCHFVQSAGVTCVTDQSTVYAAGDTSGYTIKLAAYSREDMGTLLDHANLLFEQNGLNRTRTFRAGGWTASLATVQALADKGFIADTSALNWARIEEWEGVQNGELYRWNKENWGPIGDTAQPYFPSESNVLTNDPPTLSILEVPDNGAMIDYVTLTEMTGLFDANWDGTPLAKPSTLMMGFHPAPGFGAGEYGRVEGFLDYVDKRLAAHNRGPAVYITLEDIVAVYKP